MFSCRGRLNPTAPCVCVYMNKGQDSNGFGGRRRRKEKSKKRKKKKKARRKTKIQNKVNCPLREKETLALAVSVHFLVIEDINEETQIKTHDVTAMLHACLA